MQGTPYIYQGEELGMTNVRFADISQYQDIETLNMYKERLDEGYSKEEIMNSIYAKGRDNARTPMQWSGEVNAGFTTVSYTQLDVYKRQVSWIPSQHSDSMETVWD